MVPWSFHYTEDFHDFRCHLSKEYQDEDTTHTITRWGLIVHFEGILPKGPYLPCVSMVGRALLAGYHWFINQISIIIGTDNGLSPVCHHYLNQCWLIVDWTHRKKLHWNFKQNIVLVFQEKYIQKCCLQNIIHLFQPQCVIKFTKAWQYLAAGTMIMAVMVISIEGGS